MIERRKQEPVEKDIAAAYKARGNVPALHEGPVHMRGDGVFCQSCGKKMPHVGPCILGKNYCENCYSVLAESTLLHCARCGETVRYKTTVSKLCPDCWLHEIDTRRSFYRYYGELLEKALRKRGIDVLPEMLEGSNAAGEATKPVIRYPWIKNILPLRDNIREGNQERVLYTVTCRGGLFALPSSGISFRYLSLPVTTGIQKWARDFLSEAPHFSYLAGIRSDGEELYIADQKGTVWSSNPAFQSDGIQGSLLRSSLAAGVILLLFSENLPEWMKTEEFDETDFFVIL